MDAVDCRTMDRQNWQAYVLLVLLLGIPMLFSVIKLYADDQPQVNVEQYAKLLPYGDGTQDSRQPRYSTDPSDPFPMPAELIDAKLMQQTAEQALAKSAGCILCHQGAQDPHFKATVRLGCIDCHGGNAQANTKEGAHISPRFPELWLSAANPVRSYTLLNQEAPEFIRFINPGDFRIAHISCGTAGCHAKEVQTNRKQIMSTGCMLWGAALYNNGAVPFKRARFGEIYGMKGAPVRVQTVPAPTEEEITKKGVVPFLDPLPRFEVGQPGNILRIFERGGRFRNEIGIPERFEEPGRPRARLSDRGLGTQNRTDPVFVSLNKTRLFDPTLNFLGTNDHPGDFRSSGCTACHVVYANDRSPVHSGPYAQYGNRGTSFSTDPTIARNEPGHPIAHRFTNSIPTSQCMICHVHPGTTVMNSFIGYLWYDEETHASLMYPEQQKKLTPAELARLAPMNPDEASARGNWSDPEFLNDIIRLNPYMDKTQFGDFHSHGWVFRTVFKKNKQGQLIDHFGNEVPVSTPALLQSAVNRPSAAKKFHQELGYVDAKTAKDKECQFFKDKAQGKPVHLLDIHAEKGMHCVDCHFVQDMHGNNRLQMEVRAACEIQCIDCHGDAGQYAALRTSGPASYTSSPDGKGRNLLAMKTPFGKPRFEVQDLGQGKTRIYQNSSVEPDLRWEIVQTRDTITPDHPRYNAKSALAKTVRFEGNQMVWGDVPAPGKYTCAHKNENISCIACHSSWNPSCYGCHLPQRANMKMPNLHNDGDVSRNYTPYNFQTLRDEVYMLARDGDVTGNRIGPARSSCAVHVGSFNGNRESIYVQQQTVSAEGYGGTAFSTNVPHTVRGAGVGETKKCTECHLAKSNDNNAWMAQLMMHGTNYLNFIGKYCWVAAGEEGLRGIVVTEQPEPQAVIGSELHRYAYPQNYAKHLKEGQTLKQAYEHPGHDISDSFLKPFAKSEVLSVQARGEYLYAACGKDGIRVFDIAFIDNKAFSERVTTAPVSPAGQRFYVPSKNAVHIAAPTTVAVDPTRTQKPENREQPIHPLFAYLYVADTCEGLILIGAATLLDGNPVNNFLKRELTFNPNGLLNGARYVTIVGTYAYVCCDAGLVVLDMKEPTKPVVTAVVSDFIKKPKAVQVQFRYAFVCDEEGIKILDVTDLANPVGKAQVQLEDARNIYLARTYAYVAAGKKGLMILDVANPCAPRFDSFFDADGCMNDVHDVKLGITYTSEFAYVADGKNGLRVVQLTSPQTPGNEGFSPKPQPRLVASFPAPRGGHFLSVSKGLDRDRAVDESGNQIGVFGRVGARPLNGDEQRKLYLHHQKPWFVSDDPQDKIYRYLRNPQPVTPGK